MKIKERYKDDSLSISGAGEKVRKLIDEHLVSLGINPKIPPVELLSPNFVQQVDKNTTPQAKASEMEHAIRKHCKVHFDEEESAKLRTWTLPDEELGEILQSPRRGDLLIRGFVDDASHTVTLWRGNLGSITVPFSAFPKSGDGTAPDFSRFAVTDCGQTVQFGDYEASTDSILYENDPDYLRTVKKNRLIADSSLGGSIRRLRLQRQLRRSDFSPVTEKTIARIERGESKNIQPKTLAVLAEKLSVSPDELASF